MVVGAAILALFLGATDQFGIPQIYPTAPGGREWVLPATGDQPDLEWFPDSGNIGKGVDSDGTTFFHTCGGKTNEVRLEVGSPAGYAWWQNVEMTFYVRRHSVHNTPDQRSHIELFARGERHSTISFVPSAYNKEVPAPAGTATPPGYPYAGLSKVNAHCVGTSYHGNVYDGSVLFEKEVTHYNGYASQMGKASVPGLKLDNWNGIKFIIQNVGTTAVHLELWLDVGATGNWILASQFDDTGSWSSSNLEGCGSAPYNYTKNMLITWAGPWATFRSDSMAMDFKLSSVREVVPLFVR